MVCLKKISIKSLLLLMVFQLFYGLLFSISLPEEAKAGGGPVNFPFGVNAHIVQRYYGDRATAFTKMNDVGIQTAREEFSWTSIESSNDNWNYTNYDQIVSDYETNQVDVLGLLVKSPSWSNGGRNNTYVPNNNGLDNNLDEWYEFVRTTVERYDGDGNNDAPGSPVVKSWELWNEPNHSYYFNVTSYDRDYWYAKMLKRGYQAVLDAAGGDLFTKSTVVFGGTSGGDNTFIYDVVNNNGGTPYCDVFAAHPYRSNQKIETYIQYEDSLQYQIGRVIALAKKYGDKPVWLTEIGWQANVVGDQAQANYLSRAMMTLFANDNVGRIYLYNLRDGGDGEWGLMDSSWNERPMYQAYQTLVAELDTIYTVGERRLVGSTTLIDNAESGLKWSYVKSNSGGNVSVTSSTEYSGDKSVYVEYNNNFYNNSYGRVVPSNTINLGDCSGYCPLVGMWVKGTNDFNLILMLWIKDATGEIFQVNLSRSPYSGWQYVTVNLNDPGHKTSHWGGDNNGQFNGNLRLDSIVVGKNYQDSTPCSGYFFLDDIRTWHDSAFKHHVVFDQYGRETSIAWSAYGTDSENLNLGYNEISKTTQAGINSSISGSGGIINHSFTEDVTYFQSSYASRFLSKGNLTNPGENTIIMAPGDSTQVEMTFSNVGRETWYGEASLSDPKAVLSTDNSLGRSSLFDDGTWHTADTQPAIMTDTDTLDSGGVTTFGFTLTAPVDADPSYYKEYFRVIADGASNMNSSSDAYFEVLIMPTVSSSNELANYMNPEINPSGWSFWWDYAIRYDSQLLSWFFDDLVPNNAKIRSMFWDSAVPYKWTDGWYFSKLLDSAVPYKWTGGYYHAKFWDSAVKNYWANKFYFNLFWDSAVPKGWAGNYYRNTFWNQAVPSNWTGGYYKWTLANKARPYSWAGGYYK